MLAGVHQTSIYDSCMQSPDKDQGLHEEKGWGHKSFNFSGVCQPKSLYNWLLLGSMCHFTNKKRADIKLVFMQKLWQKTIILLSVSNLDT